MPEVQSWIKTFHNLKHFKAQEFDHPDLMDPEFMRLLDFVRTIGDIPFRVTSDARTPHENKSVGGSSSSLHMRGKAVDFAIWPWTAVNWWKVVRSVALSESIYKVTFELELVKGPTDRHIHLGLQPEGQPGELILALD